MDRAAIGLGSVFLHLGAEANWHRLFHELIDGFDVDAVSERQTAALNRVDRRRFLIDFPNVSELKHDFSVATYGGHILRLGQGDRSFCGNGPAVDYVFDNINVLIGERNFEIRKAMRSLLIQNGFKQIVDVNNAKEVRHHARMFHPIC